MLDERRLFLLIGDVAGKGLSASIFMAVSKALYKSAMLRAPDADIGAIMVVANGEVSRDNPGNLFVTAFAAILDLDSGELRYCNAGHDNPYRLHPSYDAPLRIDDGDGPPLCAVPDFDYRGARCSLLPGEMLCLMTDGVTEAQTAAGALYGNERLHELLQRLQRDAAGAKRGGRGAACRRDGLCRRRGAGRRPDHPGAALERPGRGSRVKADASGPGSPRAGCAPRPRRRRWARSARACRGRRRRCSPPRCRAPPARGAPPRRAGATAHR